MTALITPALLRVAAQADFDLDAPGEFALWVIDEASGVVCDVAKHPEWEVDTVAPRTARRICLAIAVRAFNNPDMEVQYNIGPIGARVREEAAYGFEPTEYELSELEALQGGTGTGQAGLWVQPLAGTNESLMSIYVKDPWGQAILFQDQGDIATGPDPDAS